jgi:hypothetical protein
VTSNKAPKPALVAKARRSGSTWEEVRQQFKVRWPSGKFTEQLNAAGFDAAGLKLDGSGPKASEARTWKTKKAPARRAVPAKQGGKKRSRS